MSERFSLSSRLASFRFALSGLRQLLASEHNARIHAVVSLAVAAAGWWLDLDRFEWGLLILAIALVWLTEAMNTAVERLGDAITPERSSQIGMAKDVAAAAVLIASIAAALIGLLVFGPHLLSLWR